jgi:hypothetical protein
MIAIRGVDGLEMHLLSAKVSIGNLMVRRRRVLWVSEVVLVSALIEDLPSRLFDDW